MIVTIHQPEHLPWLGYFHKMAMADSYVMLDATQYRHQYFQNRNKIIGNQEPLWVTVPIQKLRSRYGLINEQLIDHSHAWVDKYWKSIEYQYHRHPYFDTYGPEINAILASAPEHLASLNYALIDFFRRAFGIETPLVLASSLGVLGQKTDLIHDLCLKTGATVYLSGPSGRDYLDETPFHRSGLAVWYHEFQHPIYPQRKKKEFTSHLSALDLLLNCGPDSRYLLGLDALEAERSRYRERRPLVAPATRER